MITIILTAWWIVLAVWATTLVVRTLRRRSIEVSKVNTSHNVRRTAYASAALPSAAEKRTNTAKQWWKRMTRQNPALQTAVPQSLHELLGILQMSRQEHMQSSNSKLVKPITKIIANIQELFTRIEQRGSASQMNLAEVEYKDRLEKLTKALASDYYLDILAHPELWDNASNRTAKVEEAVDATAQQIILNIQQINASRDLEFKSAIRSLISSGEVETIANRAYDTSENLEKTIDRDVVNVPPARKKRQQRRRHSFLRNKQ